MKIRFLTTARRELVRVAEWYDDRSLGLGDRFLDDVGRGLRAVVDFPETHAKVDAAYRRCALAVFPYVLVYRSTFPRTGL